MAAVYSSDDTRADDPVISRSPTLSILKAWIWWGTLTGASALSAVVVTALALGAVGAVVQSSPDGVARSALGVLSLPGFALEGAVAGSLLGAVIGLVAAVSLRSPFTLSRAQHRTLGRVVGSSVFGVAAMIVVRALFDAGRAFGHADVGWIRWGSALAFGFLVWLVCFHTSAKPADAYSVPYEPFGSPTTEP